MQWQSGAAKWLVDPGKHKGEHGQYARTQNGQSAANEG
jgi:hypothetical protein